MTWLVNQSERYLGSGVLTPGFSVYIASLFCPETTHWVIPAFYLCCSMNWDPFTKADLYYQYPRRPTNWLSSLIIIFGFCSIEGLIFGNHRLQKTLLIYHPRNHLFCELSISNSGSEAQAWYTVLWVAQLLCILNSLFIEQVKLITQKCCFRQSNGHTIKLFIS